ncbi:MAG: glucose-1-phosphate adenylyltransferase subunit GlgD [Clostridia bacterium]|nr:glucose-1-phosphate adenylyltransferase subunit GlgD [Clostridia bacterium]
MKNKMMMGIIFGNTHDDLLKELTEQRAISSLPFGGRYRLIDFSLSNLVGADVERVAVLTNSNYKSLMDHVGSGKAWDLARKHGGLYIMPPYASNGAGANTDKVSSLHGILGFLHHSDEQYVALCDGDVISTIKMKDMLATHIEKGADITIAYCNGEAPKGENDVLGFTVDGDGKITEAAVAQRYAVCDYSLDVVIMKKELLIQLVEDAMSRNRKSYERDILLEACKTHNVYGYKVEGYTAVIDGMQNYVKANMDLLDKKVRDDLFGQKRPVYTKIRNEMPAKYGLDSKVSNSLVADGCIIEGTVENSILFRGVKVGKDSIVKNCILMQSTDVGDGVSLDHVCTDKNVKICDRRTLVGTPAYTVFIRKGSEV